MPKSGHGTLTIYTDVDTGGLSSGIKGITKSINKLSSSLKLTVGIAGFLALSKSAVDAASDLQEYRNVAEVTFGSLIGKLDELLEVSLESYGMSRLMATQAASGFMAMGNAAGVAKEESAEMAVGLTQYMADFASFYNLTQERARTALAAVYTGETETLKQYGIMLQETNLQQYENTYGLGRSIKTMTAAEKVQLRYNYVLHVGADAMGDFARTSGNWSNQTRVLTERWKEFLVMLGNGLITVLTPAVRILNQLIDVTMKYTKTLGDSIAIIFGIQWQDLQEQQKQSAEAAESMAESQDAAAKATANAAKSAKRALQPFDKLNNIQTNTSSAQVTPELEIDSVEDSVEKSEGLITSAIDSLYKLGAYLSQTLQNTLERIDWDEVYAKLSGFGAGVAEFLNGTLSVDALSSVAETLAHTLNSLIKSALTFARDFDWTALGTSIADAINTVFTTFNGDEFAEAFNEFADGIQTALLTAVKTIDWSSIKHSIKEMFSSIEIDTLALVVGAIAIPKFGKLLLESLTAGFAGNTLKLGVGKLFSKLFSSGKLLDTGDFVGNLIDSFKLAFGGAGSLSEAIKVMFGPIGGVAVGIITLLSGVVTAVVNFIEMFKDGFSWLNEIFMVIGTAITAVGAVMLGIVSGPVAAIVAAIVAAVATIVVLVKDNWEIIKEAFSSAWESIKGVWNVVAEWFNTKVITPIADFFKEIIPPIAEFFTNAWETIKSTWQSVSTWFMDNVITPLVDFFVGLSTRLGQIFEGCWIIIQAVWMVVSEWFNENVIVPVVRFFTTCVDKIKKFFSDLWESIKTIWKGVANWFQITVINPLTNFFKPIVANITGFFTSTWNTIKGVWQNVSSWFTKNVIEPFTTAWEEAVNAIGGFFDKIWSGILTGVANAMNAVIGVIESAINWIADGINNMLSGFNGLVDWAADKIGANWGGVDLVKKVSLARVPIPKLATGAVIPPNKQFLAVLGDQKSGTNVEAPLDTIKQALIEALQSSGFGSDNGDIVIKIGEDEIFRAVRRQSDRYFNRTGQSAFNY